MHSRTIGAQNGEAKGSMEKPKGRMERPKGRMERPKSKTSQGHTCAKLCVMAEACLAETEAAARIAVAFGLNR